MCAVLDKTSVFGKRQLAILLLIVVALLIFFCHLFVKLYYDPAIPFLKTDKHANWILYQIQTEPYTRKTNFLNLGTRFGKDFELAVLPAAVKLHIKAFRRYRLWVNGVEVAKSSVINDGDRLNWKEQDVWDITEFLGIGRNNIKVEAFTDLGPPALWLYTEGLDNDIMTDTSWMVSVSGSPFCQASLANDCTVHPISLEAVPPAGAFVRKLPVLGIFFVVCAGVFLLHSCGRVRRSQLRSISIFSPEFVLVFLTAVWVVLFVNNSIKLPVRFGFDIVGHLHYINYILSKGHLPLADEGWQAYQPPLFYVASASIVKFVSVFTGRLNAYYFLKLIPFLGGLGQIYLAYFASKKVFPDSKPSQSLSLIIAGFIPMNIYISHHLSNESLSAFLIGLSILLTIMVLNHTRSRPKFYCLVGIVIGLALLTKFTALGVLPVIVVILVLKLAEEKTFSIRHLGGYLFLFLLSIAMVAGWFYLRNWVHFKDVLIANWGRLPGDYWWQDPGYHTYRYFCQFGRVFQLPYFAGFYSLFDSMYSTFWSDAFLSGIAEYAYRPPWNYEYISAVYLLAIPASLFIILGVVRAAGRVIFGASKLWLLILGSIFVIVYSMVYMNLRIPCWGQAKASYGLFTILPVSLIFAFGLDCVDGWLRNRGLTILRAILYGWLGTFAFSVFFSYFISPAQINKARELYTLS
ncbi:MAG: glycosyltransferase family 39 protein, partial [Sedimentisphaerales bacterium]|nr:glycosyltransferase family 39 protein [Sedimentisphaerales bacterium]